MDWWVIPLVAGAAYGGYWLGSERARARATRAAREQRAPAAPLPTAKPESPPAESPPAASPRERLLQCAVDLRDVFTLVAHPEDLPTVERYRDAVAELSGPDFALDDLFGYLVGDNSVLASAAADALGERQELAGRELSLVPRLEGVSIYARHFLLRAIRRCPVPEAAFQVMLKGDGSWGSAMGMDLMRGYLRDHLDAEYVAAPKQLARLRACPEGQREWLDSLLQPIETPAAKAVLAALGDQGNRGVDLSELRKVVRLIEGRVGAGAVLDSTAQSQAKQELTQALQREPPRSLLLTGEPGVGKATLARDLAAQLALDGWTVFTAGASQLMAGQSYIGQIEQRLQDLIAAVGKRPKVLWLVPDFAEFVHAGRTTHSRVSLLDLLLPHLVTGELRLLAPMAPEAWEQLMRQEPALRTAMATVRLHETSSDETLQMGRQWLARTATDGVPLCNEALLCELFSRAQQHFAHEARPGCLLRLLGLLHEAVRVPGVPARAAVLDDAIALIARLSGLPPAVLDERDGLDLDGVRRAFSARVMGQPEAVDCLVERIAMLKAGLCDPKRPLGVFLFTGPTGTGKTELCRALAAYLFGSEERMLRLDMSEFQHPEAIGRLTGDADDVHGRQALVHRIREQPFSVVLFDEIEKAHPMVFDLFLQVFDEGRLTDRRGRTADFRHAIVIMTSNLGVRDFEGAGLGFGGREPDLHKALEEVFRREFLNRIDRVVVFRALDPATLREVLHKELDLVLQRRGLQRRPWAVEWDESALQFLLAQGCSPTLGARPLRRAIERHVLAPLAAAIVTEHTPAGDQFLFVRSDGRAVQVEFVDPDAPVAASAVATVSASVASLRTLAREAVGKLSETLALQREIDELRTRLGEEAWTARKEAAYAAMGEADFWTSARRHALLGLAELASRIEKAIERAGERAGELAAQAEQVQSEPLRRLAARVLLLQLAFAAIERGCAQDAYVSVAPVHDPNGDAAATAAFAQQLVAMYRSWAERRGMELRMLDGAGKAVLIAVAGFAAWPILGAENGLHVLESESTNARTCRVRVVVVPQPDAPVAAAAEPALARECLKPAQSALPVVVRRYRREPSPEVRDRVRGWRTGRWDRVMGGEFDVME
ncbi:MAG: AAA family ATPase [Planctomycetota bacterium]